MISAMADHEGEPERITAGEGALGIVLFTAPAVVLVAWLSLGLGFGATWPPMVACAVALAAGAGLLVLGLAKKKMVLHGALFVLVTVAVGLGIFLYD